MLIELRSSLVARHYRNKQFDIVNAGFKYKFLTF